MSTILRNSFLAGALAFGFCQVGSLAQAQTVPGAVTLWHEPLPRGGWVPFGLALQDSEVPAGAKGLQMTVDWTQATWGVGVRYETDAKIAGTTPLPKLTGFHELRFEVRGETSDSTTVTVELARQKDEKTFRLSEASDKKVTTTWQTLDFKIPQDFPGLGADALATVDGLRFLFLHADKSGQNVVEFRNVTLLP